MKISLYQLEPAAKKENKRKSFLKPGAIDDDDFKYLTGVSKANFENLYSFCEPILNDWRGDQRSKVRLNNFFFSFHLKY